MHHNNFEMRSLTWFKPLNKAVPLCDGKMTLKFKQWSRHEWGWFIKQTETRPTEYMIITLNFSDPLSYRPPYGLTKVRLSLCYRYLALNSTTLTDTTHESHPANIGSSLDSMTLDHTPSAFQTSTVLSFLRQRAKNEEDPATHNTPLHYQLHL